RNGNARLLLCRGDENTADNPEKYPDACNRLCRHCVRAYDVHPRGDHDVGAVWGSGRSRKKNGNQALFPSSRGLLRGATPVRDVINTLTIDSLLTQNRGTLHTVISGPVSLEEL